jgi:hypothetical protein
MPTIDNFGTRIRESSTNERMMLQLHFRLHTSLDLHPFTSQECTVGFNHHAHTLGMAAQEKKIEGETGTCCVCVVACALGNMSLHTHTFFQTLITSCSVTLRKHYSRSRRQRSLLFYCYFLLVSHTGCRGGVNPLQASDHGWSIDGAAHLRHSGEERHRSVLRRGGPEEAAAVRGT